MDYGSFIFAVLVGLVAVTVFYIVSRVADYIYEKKVTAMRYPMVKDLIGYGCKELMTQTKMMSIDTMREINRNIFEMSEGED